MWGGGVFGLPRALVLDVSGKTDGPKSLKRKSIRGLERYQN